MNLRLTELLGLPAHPLLNHASVVFVPLAAILAIVVVLRPGRASQYRWPVFGFFVFTVLAVWVTVGSGEELHDTLQAANPAWSAGNESFPDHEVTGRNMLPFSNWLLIATVLWVVFDRLGAGGGTGASAGAGAGGEIPERVSDREPMTTESGSMLPASFLRYGMLATRGLLLLSTMWLTYAIIQAGHSGAASVWK